MKKWIKRSVMAVVLLGVIGGAGAWFLRRGDGQAISFETAKVTRGDLVVTISASGTLEPEEVVDVGAQISGRIVSFGKDTAGKSIDYGSVVERNAVVARIDDSLYRADVAQADAQVASAKAGVDLAEVHVKSLGKKVVQAAAQRHSVRATSQRAEADLGQLKAKLRCAQRDWDRAKRLGPSEALAQSAFDQYESAYEIAKANLAVGEAALVGAKADAEASDSAVEISQADVVEGEASLAQARAAATQADQSVWRARQNLEYCTITSPIDGTVIDRRVSIGQTVAAGLNTPSLFLIARDLKRMQVWVSVNEADISRVYPGQPVTFTVDAFPDETFHGRVNRIRPNASMTQNVVTFTVEISADNSNGKLKPYLTANARFEVSRRDNVLMVPTAALSWTPSADQVAPDYRNGPPSGPPSSPPSTPGALPGGDSGPPKGPEPTTRPAGDAGEAKLRPAVLWGAQGQYVRPVPVLAGLSDGTNTMVIGEGLSEGMDVVTGVNSGGSAAQTESGGNPFMPKPPKNFKPPAGGPPPM